MSYAYQQQRPMINNSGGGYGYGYGMGNYGYGSNMNTTMFPQSYQQQQPFQSFGSYGNGYASGYANNNYRMAGVGTNVTPTPILPTSSSLNPNNITNVLSNTWNTLMNKLPQNLTNEWSNFVQNLDLNSITPQKLMEDWNGFVSKFPQWRDQLNEIFQTWFTDISKGFNNINPMNVSNNLNNFSKNSRNMMTNNPLLQSVFTKKDLGPVEGPKFETSVTHNNNNTIPNKLSPFGTNSLTPTPNLYNRSMSVMNAPTYLEYWPYK
jgi:hypothetical protein